MQDILQKLMQGVDPGAPGAFWQLLHNMLAIMPWWQLLWFTLACAVVGAVLGWWRGRIVLGIAIGLLIGPLGWIALWALPPGRYGPARKHLDARMALSGAANTHPTRPWVGRLDQRRDNPM